MRTAKRDGIERKVALSLAYEPWAKELYSFFQERKTDYVFPFTRQKVWLSSKQIFDNLNYPIEEYRIKRDGSLQVFLDMPDPSDFMRSDILEPVNLLVIGFDGFSLATYGGWKYSTMARTSSVMDRYLSLSWQSYIEKLFKER